MPLPASEQRRVSTCLAGLLLGAAVVLPTQAFTPFSGPLLSASPVPANVLVLFDNSSSMVLNSLDGQTWLEVARQATKNVIADNRHLRFGLFTFREATAGDHGPGGLLRVEAGSIAADSAEGVARFNALNQALDGLDPSTVGSTGTPLAESWYEVTRYLRGMRAFYPQTEIEAARELFSSPLQYRCQKNIGLIVTDGLPTYDSEFPDNLGDEPDGNNPWLAGSFNLPDWDGDGADETPGAAPSTAGSTFYLDDIARFAYQTDLRRGGTDLAGKSWDDPQFPLQNLRTYTLGFMLDDPRLVEVAAAGNGRYFSASDAAQLQAALQAALRDMGSAAGSGGGAVVDGAQLRSGSRHYQTHYDPVDWSGSLRAYQLDASGQPTTLLWSTDDSFRPGSPGGEFQTWRWAEDGAPAGAVALDHNALTALSSAQQQLLESEARLAGLSGQGIGQRLLDWARGVSDAELRSRQHLLGDIIHSAPLLTGADHHPLAAHPSADYAAYLQLRREQMPEALLLGANDGFLRLFAADGSHLYSYLPAAAQSGLGVRARTDYGGDTQHRAGVDGRFSVADVRLGGDWSSVAAGGLGAGGRGLQALRLFDERQGVAARGVLWEADPGQLPALGHIYGQPAVVSAHGHSLLITGNGYGSPLGQAALLIFDLHTGALLNQLEVPARAGGGSNGLSVPGLQFSATGELQAAFAGDLHGRLWKFDLSNADPRLWLVAHGGAPLFSAAEGQPITAPPILHTGMTGDADLLLFGTGKWLEATDLQDHRPQAFYAVLDTPTPPPGGLTPVWLQEQQLSTGSDPISGQALRTVSSSAVDWGSHYGWYVTLTDDSGMGGERVTQAAVIQHSRVLFTSGYLHSEAADPCVTRAGGWLMSLALGNGGMPALAGLDSNADGRVDGSDTPAAGLALGIGLPGAISVLSVDAEEQPPGCDAEVYLVQGSTAVAALAGQAHCQFNRILWRQLQ